MKPTYIKQYGQGHLIICPECQFKGRIDIEQLTGRVSIDCPNCPYHETHDLSKDFMLSVGIDPWTELEKGMEYINALKAKFNP